MITIMGYSRTVTERGGEWRVGEGEAVRKERGQVSSGPVTLSVSFWQIVMTLCRYGSPDYV